MLGFTQDSQTALNRVRSRQAYCPTTVHNIRLTNAQHSYTPPAPQHSTSFAQNSDQYYTRSSQNVLCRCTTGSAASVAPPSATSSPPISQAGLVLSLGSTGSWDEAAVGSPVVRCYVGDNEQRWFMWYSGRREGSPAAGGVDVLAPSSGSVGVAVSRDGINWARGFDSIEGSRGADAAADVGSVMVPNQDWWTFDTCHLAPADVQVLSNSSVSSGVGVYWMFYCGGDYEPVKLPPGIPGAEQVAAAQAAAAAEAEAAQAQAQAQAEAAQAQAQAQAAAGASTAPAMEGLRLRPGLAMSQDGRNWARIEADHHTGALFDVGGDEEPDQIFVGSSQVLAVAPRDLRMYYTTWDVTRRRFVVHLASSPDGFKWTKKGVLFDPAAISVAFAAGSDDEDDGSVSHDARGAAAISVVRDVDNRQYLMFYEAVAIDNRRSIGLAVSKDGMSWRRYPAPVLVPEEEASGSDPWDGGDVGSPCAVSMSAGRWRLYYGGRRQSGPGPWQGIGLALSVEGGPTFEGVPVQFRRRAPKPEGA